MTPLRQRVEFPGSDGQLAGRLQRPLGAPRAYALFAHCFTCSKDLRAVGRISQALADEGIATLRFDFTGLGESEGDFADTNFSSNVDDLVKAAEFLAQSEQAPQILIGHSLGGAAVLVAAQRIPSIKAVATIGAPAEPAHVQHLFAAAAPELEAQGEACVVLAGRQFKIKKQLVDDLESTRLQETLTKLDRALLVLHSPQDEIVDIDNARKIYVSARHPKSFVSLDGANHLLTRASDADYAARVIATWASRYVEPAARPAEDAFGDWEVVVSGGPQGYRNEVLAGKSRHHLVADEPTHIPGGTDEGPTPYDLLNAALGTCTAMTLRMYADRKKWPLEGVQVRLRHRKVHAKDCQDCETKAGKVDEITRELVIEGPLDAEQRARLVEIADRCPVHRTLHSEVKIRTELVE